MADQVLGSFEPEQLLVVERGQPGRGGEPAGKSALADAAGAGDLGERQRGGQPVLDEILSPVRGVTEVVAVPQHGAGLLLVAVAARVDDHLAGDPGGHRRAVPDRDQVQGQVDAAGDPGRGRDPVVHDVEDVADDRRPRVAPGQLVLDVVVGGAPALVKEAGPAEGVGARADAGDGAAVRVVAAQPREGGLRERAGARASGGRPPSGDDDEVSWR